MLLSKKIIVLIPTLFCLKSFSQENQGSFKWYGFVRTEFYTDTRKMYTTNLDVFSFYPMYENANKKGEDLSAVPSSGMVCANTRIGLDFSGQTDFFHAKKYHARIETDFGGGPTYVALRVRQAYTQFFWNKSDFLIGQTWHPFFIPESAPNVLSLNAGSPFQPFNRSPMLRYNLLINKLKLTAAAVYQMSSVSQGPDETTPTKNVGSAGFQKNALLPEFFVGLEYKTPIITIGAGGSYKTILPERYYKAGDTIGINHRVLTTPAAMVYGIYKSKMLTIKTKTIFGQNLTEQCLVGGYAITTENKYIPYNSMSSYLHIHYGKKYQWGCMGGYAANLGPAKSLPTGSSYYGFGVENANTTGQEKIIKNLYRVSPSISYNTPSWQMGVELEYTQATWGDRSVKDGNIEGVHSVDNKRVYALLMYLF